jgi:hypothetical protein
LNTFVIQTSEEAVLVIAGRVKSDQLGGTSGQTAALSISSSTLPSTAAFQARGVSSTQELTQNDANVSATGEIFVGTASNGPNVQITGRTNDTAFASIGAVTNDGLTNGGSIPSGFMPFGWFKIAALPHSNSQQACCELEWGSAAILNQPNGINPLGIEPPFVRPSFVTAPMLAKAVSFVRPVICTFGPLDAVPTKISPVAETFASFCVSSCVEETPRAWKAAVLGSVELLMLSAAVCPLVPPS